MARIDRRRLLMIGAVLPLAGVAACTQLGGDLGFDTAIRRLLNISTQRAFARLAEQNGFFGDSLALGLPAALGGNASANVLGRVLATPVVQGQLVRLVNDAAWDAAQKVTPLIYDSIRSLGFSDAIGIVRGGPQAATGYLQQSIGDRIVTAMFPDVGNALRALDGGALGQVLGAITGIDLTGLQRDTTGKAATAIWGAIGREEAAIRANPRGTGDPVIASVFGALG